MDDSAVTTPDFPTYTVDVCDAWWNLLGQLNQPDSLTMVDRLCDVGTGALDCPATPANLDLVGRGATLLVRRDDQERSVRQAGLITPFGVSRDDSDTLKVSWRDPLAYLAAQPAFPNPGTATGQGPNEYDRRSGWASSVVLGYVAANIGPNTGWRQAPGLVVDQDPQVGNLLSAPVEARWNNLLDLNRTIAIPNGIAFATTTVDRSHHFAVRAVRDLSADVAFSAELENLGTGEYKITAPQATRVLGLGRGDGTARVAVLVDSPESREQEQRWGWPSIYVHDSSSADVDALTAEALRALAEKGETVEATYQVSASGSFRYGVDYLLGDFVTLQPAGIDPILKPVREVQETVSASQGWVLTVTVGDYAATASTGAAFKAREVLRVVDALKRNR